MMRVALLVLFALVPAAVAGQPAPSSPPGLSLEVRDHLKAGRMDDAIDAYDRARGADGGDPSAVLSLDERLRLTAGLADQGRYDEAVLQVVRARQLYAARPGAADDYWEARRVLSRINALEGNLTKAAATLRPCVQPAAGVPIAREERRACLLLIAGVLAQSGTFAQAEEAVDDLLTDARGPQRLELLLFKGLLLDARGAVPEALRLFRDHHGDPASSVFMAAYYAGLAPDIPADARSRLRSLLAARAKEEPFLARWAVVVLHRREGGDDDRRLVAAALDGFVEPRNQDDVSTDAVARKGLQAMMAAFEERVFERFLTVVGHDDDVATVAPRPTLFVEPATAVPADRPLVALRVTLSSGRGVRRLVIRGRDNAVVIGVRASRFRLFRPTPSGGIEGIVNVPLVEGLNDISVAVETVSGETPFRALAVEYRKDEPRLQVLIAAVERYGSDRSRFVATATADATRLARAWANLGHHPVSVDVLLNDHATKENIQQWVTRPRRPDAAVVIVLRGMDAVVTAPGARPDFGFVPVKGVPGDAATLLGMGELLGWLETAGIAEALVLLNTESTQSTQTALEVLQLATATLLWTARPPVRDMAVIGSQLPLYSARTSPDHGQSVFTLGLLDGLNGGLYGDLDDWDGRLSSDDLVSRLERYLKRDIVVRAFGLQPGHRLFRYQRSLTAFHLADQTSVRDVLRKARAARYDPRPHIRARARAALRLCLSTSRTDAGHARLTLLAGLLRDYPDDVPRALAEWDAAE